VNKCVWKIGTLNNDRSWNFSSLYGQYSIDRSPGSPDKLWNYSLSLFLSSLHEEAGSLITRRRKNKKKIKGKRYCDEYDHC
jgi:hypothetical protein